jgi:hypothetical protein
MAKNKKQSQKNETIHFSEELSVELKIFRQSLFIISNNLNFFKACSTRLVNTLRQVKDQLQIIEALYVDYFQKQALASEAKKKEVLIHSEILQVLNLNNSTKFKGVSLMDSSSDNFIAEIALIIDVYESSKYKLDFKDFDLTLSEPESGINIGSKNVLLKNQSNFENVYDYKNFEVDFNEDFANYKFNVDKLLDKVYSLDLMISQKLEKLDELKKKLACDDSLNEELQKLDIKKVTSDLTEDSRTIFAFQ